MLKFLKTFGGENDRYGKKHTDFIYYYYYFLKQPLSIGCNMHWQLRKRQLLGRSPNKVSSSAADGYICTAKWLSRLTSPITGLYVM